MRGSFGVSVALTTPFSDTGEISLNLLGAHAISALAAGANTVTLCGTTGEGASLGTAERRACLTALLSQQCPPEKIILAVCANAIGDAQAQITEGLKHGVTRFLVLPPFYFKEASDQALFDWYATLLAQTDPSAQIILYHIPQITQIPLSVDLVIRLAAHAPDRLIGIKDSSGDWQNAKALIATNALPVLVGDERLLHRAVALGGAGCISGVANLCPMRLAKVIQTATEDPWITRLVDRVVSVPVIPALKAMLAEQTGDQEWEHLRPPLEPLSQDQRADLFADKEVS